MVPDAEFNPSTSVILLSRQDNLFIAIRQKQWPNLSYQNLFINLLSYCRL